MSALTDKIAREHRYLWSNAHCGCGFDPVWSEDYGAHIAEVTEATVRERVAQDIEDRFAPVLAVAGVVRVAIRLCIAIVRGDAS